MAGYYHVYNRGAHKALIFNNPSDYRRFLALLYIGNNAAPVNISKLSEEKIYSMDRKNVLVNIIAYCLMPNHFHIALREDKDGAMTSFLRKICTGYSMYYNIKYKHSGTIIQGKFKVKEITNERYLNTVINYIHLNPYKIIEPDISSESFMDPKYLNKAIEYSKKYKYSSYKEYLGETRVQGKIIAKDEDEGRTFVSEGPTFASPS
jgi:putative transposase